jgi:chromate transporter
MHVFFGIVTPISIGPLQLIVPEITTLQIVPVAIAALAAFLLLRRHWGLPLVLLICAIVGLFSTGLGLPL